MDTDIRQLLQSRIDISNRKLTTIRYFSMIAWIVVGLLLVFVILSYLKVVPGGQTDSMYVKESITALSALVAFGYQKINDPEKIVNSNLEIFVKLLDNAAPAEKEATLLKIKDTILSNIFK